MDWKIISIREVTDIAESGGFIRYKKVIFEVNGNRHTIRVSMPDFDKNKTHDIVKREADKIIKAYSGK